MNGELHYLSRLLTLSVCVLLSACVANSVKHVNSTMAEHAERDIPKAQLLDINIARFDPGFTLPLDDDSGIFPEVRKAEAGFFPWQLRETLQSTGHWGPVRVIPDTDMASELLVTGKILHSDGLTLKLHIRAVDATGRVWLDRNYEESAAQLSYTDTDTADIDPFQDLYNRVANDLLKERRSLSGRDLADVRKVAFLRFANDVAPDAFGDYVQKKGPRYVAKGMPAASDPNVERVNRIRERDYRLVDALDQHYYVFSEKVQLPYDEWRAASYQEAKNLQKLRNQAMGRMLAGAAGVAAGIYGAGNSSNGSELAASQVAILGGAYLFKSGLDKREESKMHKEALKELGESLESDVKPKTVELQGQTVTLKGSAEAQYEEWRKLMRRIYAEETGFIPEEPASPNSSSSNW